MHLGPQTHAHSTHREHRVQSGDSEVKSIVRFRGRACAGALVLYYASLINAPAYIM